MRANKNNLLATTMLAGAASFTAGGQAVAQQQDAVENITITGSRIARSSADTPTPVTFLNREEIELRGEVSLLSILEDLPAIGVGTSTSNSGLTTNSAGLQTVDIRNLGSVRTLVLVNGRRFVPSTNTGTVDLSAIPPGFVERVETITGGASAVYGSEAVAGVVNIITRQNFEGVLIDAQAGISDEGDGLQVSSYALIGGDFADGRGNAMVGVSYNMTDEIRSADRETEAIPCDFTPSPNSLLFCSGANPPGFLSGALGVPGGSSRTPQGTLRIRNNITFNDTNGNNSIADERAAFYGGLGGIGSPANATSTMINPTDGTIDNVAATSDFFNFAQFTFINTPQENVTIAGQATYEVANNINFFLEGNFAQTRTDGVVAPTLSDGIDIPLTNPNLDQSILDLFAAAQAASVGDPSINTPTDFVTIRRRFTELGPRTNRIERDVFRFALGFNGELGNGWSWETYYQYGRHQNRNLTEGLFRTDLLLTALDPQLCADYNANIVNSTVGKNNGTVPCPGAIDLIASPGEPIGFTISPDQAAFIAYDDVRVLQTSQQVLSGVISGDLYELPAGPLGFAAGVEYRKESGDDIPSPLVQAGNSSTNRALRTQGAVNVTEVFGEFRIPILARGMYANGGFDPSFEIDGAVRYSDFSSLGEKISWKLGGQFSPVDDIRLRGSFDEAFRAPNVAELFTGGNASFNNAGDPCIGGGIGAADPDVPINCAAQGISAGFVQQDAQVRTFIIGNPDLQEEKATTYTIGAVVTPRWIPGLSVAIDYWDIEIEDAITNPGPTTLLNNCFNSTGLSDPACASISRQAGSNQIQRINRVGINAGTLERNGIDVEMNYAFDLNDAAALARLNTSANLGSMNLRFIGTWLDEYRFQATQGGPINVLEGTLQDPKTAFNIRLTHNLGNWSASWFVNYLGEQDNITGTVDPNTGTFTDGLLLGFFPRSALEPNLAVTPAQFYNNITVRYQPNETVSLRVGVNNIFDRDLPLALSTSSAAGINVDNGVYDFAGRYIFAGATLRF